MQEATYLLIIVLSLWLLGFVNYPHLGGIEQNQVWMRFCKLSIHWQRVRGLCAVQLGIKCRQKK